MRTEPIYKHRMRVWADFLDTVPEGTFDLREWECGSTACAAGWACRIPEFQEVGLELIHNELNPATYPSFRGYDSYSAVREFFGLDLRECDRIVDERHYDTGRKTKPSVVAERIRETAGIEKEKTMRRKLEPVFEERLRILADHLDTVPPESFGLSDWESRCGTVACTVGHACRIPAFQAAGLRMERYFNSAGVMNAVPEFGDGNQDAVEVFFGLTEDEVYWLFFSHMYPDGDGTTKEQVSARIREFAGIEKGPPKPSIPDMPQKLLIGSRCEGKLERHAVV
jgi:hypothetical protein